MATADSTHTHTEAELNCDFANGSLLLKEHFTIGEGEKPVTKVSVKQCQAKPFEVLYDYSWQTHDGHSGYYPCNAKIGVKSNTLSEKFYNSVIELYKNSKSTTITTNTIACGSEI